MRPTGACFFIDGTYTTKTWKTRRGAIAAAERLAQVHEGQIITVREDQPENNTTTSVYAVLHKYAFRRD